MKTYLWQVTLSTRDMPNKAGFLVSMDVEATKAVKALKIAIEECPYSLDLITDYKVVCLEK
jgi:hypothetical protein